MVTEKPKTANQNRAAGAKAAASGAKPRRPGQSKPAAVKAPRAPKPAVAVVASVPVSGGTLRKKQLLERVAAASGAKKKDARDIVEAVLKVLGDALHAGEILALPPFGKARVNRQKDTAGGEMLVVKLRRDTAVKSGVKPRVNPAKEVLAEPTE